MNKTIDDPRHIDLLKTIMLIVFAIIVTAFILSFFSSCVTQKKCNDKFPCKNTEKIVHDTVIKTTVVTNYKDKPDTVSIKALIKCDSLGRAYIAELYDYKTGKKIQVRTEFKDRWFKVECTVDSMGIYKEFKEKYKSDSVTTVTKIVETNIFKWWQKVLMYIGGFASVIILCYSIFKITKSYIQ